MRLITLNVRMIDHTPQALCVRVAIRVNLSKDGTVRGDALNALAVGEDGTVIIAGWSIVGVQA